MQLSPAHTKRLQQQLQSDLIGFLRVELEIATTLLETARFAKDDDHRMQLVRDIRSAIAAVRHFQGRVQDRLVGEQIVVDSDRLEREVSKVLATMSRNRVASSPRNHR
jgi:hypothetical protein